jgi:hypothetical protein
MNPWTRRDFTKSVVTIGAGVALAPGRGWGGDKPVAKQRVSFHAPLSDATNLTVEGPHRFAEMAGWRGFQPTSLRTKAKVATTAHRTDRGCLTFWFAPLEDMDFYSMPQRISDKSPGLGRFPLVSDTYPGREIEKMAFGIYWTMSYPQFLGKFATGDIWSKLDHGLAPFVYAENLCLCRGCWYYVTLTWDKPGGALRLYVNGRKMGTSDIASEFSEASDALYVGNPMMLMRNLRIEEEIPDESTVVTRYHAERPKGNDRADEDIRQAVDVLERPPLDISRDSSWREAFTCAFSKQADLDPWVFQTGDKYREQIEMKIGSEGLLIRTPAIIEVDSRMYLWSPRNFEGDQWIEYDFRPESKDGLALLAVCCRGPQREDLLDDRLENSGSMGVILNRSVNYHWEYFRRVEIMRRDVETQYVSKNPWHWHMHYGCIPKLEVGQWHRLRFVKMGCRLHGSIDGRTVFDVKDDPLANNGSVLNFGRIGLRHMYNTAVRYRNLSVHERRIT